MIPKIIHYCWFGKNEMPNDVVDIIEHWKQKLQGYEFMLWNEENFDFNTLPFSKEAYEAKKFAFVADVCRLHALYNYGGIYLDTDVEIIKPFDDLLHLDAFIGFEDEKKIGTSVIASVPKGDFIKEFLDIYTNRNFFLSNKRLNMVSNVDLITAYLDSKTTIINTEQLDYENKLIIFSRDYFSPKNFDTKEIKLTKNTYSIHHFSQSWFGFKKKSIQFLKRISWTIIGYKNTKKIINFIKNE